LYTFFQGNFWAIFLLPFLTHLVFDQFFWDIANFNIYFAGLLKTESPDARKMALTIARRYTNGAIFSCPDGAEVCNMFEKYNVNDTGSAGGGGNLTVFF